MTSREAFISLCITLANIDDDFDPEEEKKLKILFERYGFTPEEVQQVHNTLKNVQPNEAFEFGVLSIQVACELDSTMRSNLLTAMEAIAEADGKIDPRESKLIKCTENMFRLMYGE